MDELNGVHERNLFIGITFQLVSLSYGGAAAAVVVVDAARV